MSLSVAIVRISWLINSQPYQVRWERTTLVGTSEVRSEGSKMLQQTPDGLSNKDRRTIGGLEDVLATLSIRYSSGNGNHHIVLMQLSYFNPRNGIIPPFFLRQG